MFVLFTLEYYIAHIVFTCFPCPSVNKFYICILYLYALSLSLLGSHGLLAFDDIGTGHGLEKENLANIEIKGIHLL